MSVMTIVRTNKSLPPDPVLEQVRSFLFGVIDGAHRDDKRAWKRVWRRFMALGPGEMAVVEMVFPRNGPFHRRHMKIEQSVFDAQDKFTDFEMFRYWLKVGAAWVTWAAGPKGGVVPIPKSISYAKANEEEFRRYHDQVIDFLRGDHAAPYLWRHLDDPREMMDSILMGFGE
jgi:hypothetical protein